MRHSAFSVTTFPIRFLVLLVGLTITAWPAATQAQSQGIPERVSDLEQRTSALEQQVSSQGQQLATVQQQLATQGQRLATQGQQLATQGQQIATLTQRIAGLQPLNLTVDCTAGQTVAGALAQAGQRPSRVVITVVGVCTEAVAIFRSNTVLRGASVGDGLQGPSATSTVLEIHAARDVILDRLTLIGGRGVQINTRSEVLIANSRVIGSSFHGVTIFSAVVDLVNTTVEGSAIVGIQAMSGSILRLNNSVVQDNRGGLDVANGSFVLLDGGTQVVSNGGGVSVSFGSTLHVGNAIVSNNRGGGVALTGGSVAHFGFGGGVGVIRENGDHGLLLRDTSVASSLFEGGTAQIIGNGGVGVFCSGSPAVAQIVGQIGTVNGNTLGDINCPVSQ